MKDRKILLHAGPPIEWSRMCGPMQGAVVGSILFQKWADTPEAAERLAASGKVEFAPCHHYGAVGPMAGLLAPDFPVFVVQNKTHGNRAYAGMNEGLGKVLRFGAYDDTVIKRLHWLKDVLAPELARVVRKKPVDLKTITQQALQMGDECHNRNSAATLLFVQAIAPELIAGAKAGGNAAQVLEFLMGNAHFYLNLSMASCKASLDAAHGVEGSSIVTVMARNGVDFGIRMSGTGDRWFTTASPVVDGLYFPGFTPADANPDMGDSSITETFGIGGFAMAAAPAITGFVGGKAADAMRRTREMYQITERKHPDYVIPGLDYAGVPTGIDARKVVELGVLPVINTGIAHKKAGIGQIGAGITFGPAPVFKEALVSLSTQIGSKRGYHTMSSQSRMYAYRYPGMMVRSAARRGGLPTIGWMAVRRLAMRIK